MPPTTGIAILTYRRSHALKTFMVSLREHCPGYPMAVFEDCGNADDTCAWLTESAKPAGHDDDMDADRWDGFDYEAYLGCRNAGVSGNSNRAILWFRRRPELMHLCLCNDDLEARGDFPAEYAAAHKATGIGLLCFNDWTDDENKPVVIRDRGRPLHLLPRRKGIMMSMTRKLVDRIGFFDAETFGKFGDEHNDYTNRAMAAGFMTVRGAPQHCLDIPCKTLAHQEVPPSINPVDKPKLDREAKAQLDVASGRYAMTDPWRPFALGGYARSAGGYTGAGIHIWSLRRMGYDTVLDGYVPDLFF